jgi:hypothetical protein
MTQVIGVTYLFVPTSKRGPGERSDTRDFDSDSLIPHIAPLMRATARCRRERVNTKNSGPRSD